MNKYLLLPLMVLTFVTPTMAQETPIDEMFKVMKMDQQFEGGFEAMMPTIDQMTAQFRLDNEGKEELKGIFRAWFNEDIDRPKIINDMKELYTQTFTDDEIIEITKFYQTPVGKKFLENSAHLMQVGAQVGMQEAQSKQAMLMERVKPFLEKHGIK
ncbi:DUF2059 domain-containing protein [Agarivorans sp. MS3-6]